MQQHRLRTSWVLILLVSACARLSAVQAGRTAVEDAAAVKACLEATPCMQMSKGTSWADFLTDTPACLFVARVWWSPRRPTMPAVLVTQLSADRVLQLTSQCSTWRGPLAAALHVALPWAVGGQLSDASRYILAAAERRIDAMYEASEEAGHCQLRVMLVYELLAEPRAASLYPVNSLRNYARLMADGDMVRCLLKLTNQISEPGPCCTTSC